MLTNIAVLVSGGGTNLQALIDYEREGRLKSGKLALVVSHNPDAFALTRAQQAGIETLVLADKQHFEEQLEEALSDYNIDLIILAGFMRILSSDFTKRHDKRIINVHPALIPSFCGKGYYGLKVHEEALKYGVKVTGATVHYVNEIPDGGEIILQKAVSVFEGDTPEILQKRVMREAEWVILPQATELVSKKIAEGKR